MDFFTMLCVLLGGQSFPRRLRHCACIRTVRPVMFVGAGARVHLSALLRCEGVGSAVGTYRAQQGKTKACGSVSGFSAVVLHCRGQALSPCACMRRLPNFGTKYASASQSVPLPRQCDCPVAAVPLYACSGWSLSPPLAGYTGICMGKFNTAAQGPSQEELCGRWCVGLGSGHPTLHEETKTASKRTGEALIARKRKK